MLLRSGRKEIEAATPAASFLPDASPFQILPWLKLPLLYISTWKLPRALFPVNMVEKEQKPSLGHQQQQKSQAEQMQTLASGDAAGSESVPPTSTRRCFCCTAHGSQMLLFLSPTTDAKHVLSKSTCLM